MTVNTNRINDMVEELRRRMAFGNPVDLMSTMEKVDSKLRVGVDKEGGEVHLIFIKNGSARSIHVSLQELQEALGPGQMEESDERVRRAHLVANKLYRESTGLRKDGYWHDRQVRADAYDEARKWLLEALKGEPDLPTGRGAGVVAVRRDQDGGGEVEFSRLSGGQWVSEGDAEPNDESFLRYWKVLRVL